MNNISQISIFDYSEIEILGDLEKLKLQLEIFGIKNKKSDTNEKIFMRKT